MKRVSEIALVCDKDFVRNLIYPLAATDSNRTAVLKRAVHRAIEEDLTPRQREMLLKKYFEYKTGKEIAEDLGVDQATVSRTLKRARVRLQKSLRFYTEFINCNLDDD